MAAALLAAHVLAAIVFVGPVTVAASTFPRYVRVALAGDEGSTARSATASAAAMHRITRVYAVLALAVPVLGIATAAALGVLGEAWVIVSMGLTAVAGVLLAVVIVPQQRRLLVAISRVGSDAAPDPQAPARLGAETGVFNLLWAVVVVLMILRPGSTTGV